MTNDERRKLNGRSTFVFRHSSFVCAFALFLSACAASAAPPELAPRRALAAGVLAGQPYAVGGWSGTTTQLDTVERLDGDRWVSGPMLNVARSQHGLVSLADRLWVVGGWSATVGLVSEVEALGSGDAVWTTVTHLPTPRREPGVAVWDQRIVVAGGFDGASDADLDGYSDVVEAYDPQEDAWEKLPRLNVPRRGLTLVAIAESLYAIGGYSTEGGYSAVVERLEVGGDAWSTLEWSIEARTWAAALEWEGDLLIVGGFDSSGYLGLVERVDVRTGSVCHPPPLARPRAWLAAAKFDGRVLTLGGEEPTGIGGAAEWIKTQCR